MLPFAFRCTLSVLFALTAATFGLASLLPPRSSYVVKEVHPVPRRWTRIGPAPRQHLIELQIGLKQNRFDELEKHLYEGISIPCLLFRNLAEQVILSNHMTLTSDIKTTFLHNQPMGPDIHSL
jgi:hypothetical protein